MTPTPGQPLSEADVGCAETPLSDLLRRVPKDAVLHWEVPEEGRALWQLASASSPVGLLMHRAADELDALRPHAPVSRPGDGVEGAGRTLGQVAYEGWAQGLPGCEWSNQTATQKRAWEKAALAVAALTPPAEPVSRPAGEGEREAVARIIREEYNRMIVAGDDRRDNADRASDRILSLLSPAAPDAGGEV